MKESLTMSNCLFNIERFSIITHCRSIKFYSKRERAEWTLRQFDQSKQKDKSKLVVSSTSCNKY